MCSVLFARLVVLSIKQAHIVYTFTNNTEATALLLSTCFCAQEHEHGFHTHIPCIVDRSIHDNEYIQYITSKIQNRNHHQEVMCRAYCLQRSDIAGLLTHSALYMGL